MIKGLEDLHYRGRLKELGLFSQEKRSFRGNLTAVFQYLQGSYKENTLLSEGATKKGTADTCCTGRSFIEMQAK